MLHPYFTKGELEAGCDEAGRGCLAGPVFAAAVMFPKGYKNETINDSKQMTEVERERQYEVIVNDALSYGIAKCSPLEIDKINILNASIKAMHKALKKLEYSPEHILVDGNRFKDYKKVRHTCVIKGDSLYLSIAAASILAKVSRDRYMKRMAKKFPGYSWETNKGYPTVAHRSAIKSLGPCQIHRMSFQLLKPEQLQFFQ